MEPRTIAIVIRGRMDLDELQPKIMNFFVKLNQILREYHVTLDELNINYKNKQYNLADLDLLEWMSKYLNYDDLKELQFRLWSDSSVITGHSKKVVAMKIIEMTDDQNRKNDLIQVLREMRPFREVGELS